MLQKMKKVLVIGPRPASQNVVDTLYNTGTLHLEDVSENIPAFAFRLRKWEEETGEEISRLLVKIGGILNTLPEVVENEERQEYRRDEVYWQNQEELISRTNHVISELEHSTKDYTDRRNDLEFSLTALARYEKTIEKIQPLEDQLPLLEGFEVSVLIVQKEFEDVIKLIEDELVRLTHNQFEIVSAEIDEVTLAAITVFHRRYSRDVHSFIFSKNVNEVRLPDEYMGKPFDEVLPLIREKKLEMEDELATIKDSLVNLAGAWYQELVVLQAVLEDKSKEMAAFSHFGSTEYTFMVTGWVPEIYLEKTRNVLSDKFGQKVVLTELSVSEGDSEKTPTLYANPRIVQPFEFFMQLLSPPNYREIDPSPLLAFFFPVFFGLMVGDIGYGLVILGLALLVKKLFADQEWLRSLANIMIISSIPAIFFGYLYGEFFGDFGEMMGWIHPVHLFGVEWNRIEAMLPLLLLAIGVGVIHVFLGLGLGVFNAYSQNNRKHMAEKIGMLAALTGMILMAGAAAAFLPAITLTVGIGLFIIALIPLFYGGGAMGALEIMGTVGNILSYARIMAIGMASVILALVANTLGGALGAVFLGIIAAVLLHSLNIVLAMFSPSLHSIRLHMVECYSKFYEGGGTLYAPFKRERKT